MLDPLSGGQEIRVGIAVTKDKQQTMLSKRLSPPRNGPI